MAETLVVRGLPDQCWKCHHEDVAVAVIHVNGLTHVNDVIPTDHPIPLGYSRELLAEARRPQAEWALLKELGGTSDFYDGYFEVHSRCGGTTTTRAKESPVRRTRVELTATSALGSTG